MVVSGNLVGDPTELRVFQIVEGSTDDLTALGGVFLHNGVFLICQLSGLLQNAVRRGYFAYIVQRRCVADIRQIVLIQDVGIPLVVTHLPQDQIHIGLCPLDVAAGIVSRLSTMVSKPSTISLL